MLPLLAFRLVKCDFARSASRSVAGASEPKILSLCWFTLSSVNPSDIKPCWPATAKLERGHGGREIDRIIRVRGEGARVNTG